MNLPEQMMKTIAQAIVRKMEKDSRLSLSAREYLRYRNSLSEVTRRMYATEDFERMLIVYSEEIKSL